MSTILIPNSESALALVFGLLEGERLKWRAVKITTRCGFAVRAFKRVREEPIRVERKEKLTD